MLEIYADENVPRPLIVSLRENGHDVVWARDVDAGNSDPNVLAQATKLRRVLLTFDSDFGELAFRNLTPAPFGIIFCRLERLLLAEQVLRVTDVLTTPPALISRLLVIESNRTRLTDLPRPSTED